jgi:hypothetical protein
VYILSVFTQKDFIATLEEKSSEVLSSILVERNLYVDNQDWCDQLPTLRKEAFITWKLTKTSKKRSADVLNIAQAADDDDEAEDNGVLMVTPPRNDHGRVVW